MQSDADRLLILDWQAIQNSRRLGSDGMPTPYGFILRNGVVVVRTGGNQNNMATLAHARAMFPNLQLLNDGTEWQ